MSILDPSDEEIAESAIMKKQSGQASTWAIAIGKAFDGKGIRNKLVIKRRRPIVAAILQRHSMAVRRARKASALLNEKISG